MTSKKSFNTLVYEKTITDLALSRLEATIFYRLLGFLLRDDKPFIYSTPKLAEKTLYKRASVFSGLDLLEQKQIIAREGFSYRRRFYKGKVLVEICTQVQILDGLELNTSPKTGVYCPKTGVYRPKTGYNKTDLKLIKHLEPCVQNLKNKPQTQRQKWPDPTAEEKDLLSAYRHGLKFNAFQLTGLDLERAKVLDRRYCLDKFEKVN